MNLALKLTEDEAVILYKAMADYHPEGKHEGFERNKLRGKLYRYLQKLRCEEAIKSLTPEQISVMLKEMGGK